jgi:hypothetical protein
VLAVEEYKQGLKDRESSIARHEQIHIRLGYVRLLLALVEAGIAWESLGRHAFSPWWVVVPLIVFVFIASIHSRILRSREMPNAGRHSISRDLLESKTDGRVRGKRANASPIPIMCMRLIWIYLVEGVYSSFSQLHARAWARRP